MIEVSGNLAFSTTTSSRFGKLKAIYSPLWLCFLLAILSRVWIIVHTNGVMAEEGKVGGVQPAHIFLGGPPPYFFCPPFLCTAAASLLAYFFPFFPPPPSRILLA